MLLASILLSAIHVSALQMTYYSDANCANNAVSAEIEFGTCNKIYEGNHTVVQSMKISRADTSQPIHGLLYNQPNCSGTISGHEFHVGDCFKSSEYSSYELAEPEEPEVQFHYYLSDDCSGEPTILDAKEVPQKFSNDHCEQPGTIKLIPGFSYPQGSGLKILGGSCGSGMEYEVLFEETPYVCYPLRLGSSHYTRAVAYQLYWPGD